MRRRECFQTARRSALLLRIIDMAFERPVPITFVSKALGVTYRAAANNLAELITHGAAEEVGGTYPKLIRFRGGAEGVANRRRTYAKLPSRRMAKLVLPQNGMAV